MNGIEPYSSRKHSRRKPALILVSGAPGSGKTQLSRYLSESLGMLRVNKSEIAKGLDVTARDDPANHARAWETYWTVLETLLDAGVSIIADQTTWRGQCDIIISSRLLARAETRNVHCLSPDSEERWLRCLAQSGRSGAELSALHERLWSRSSRFDRPLDLARPVLDVDTTDGYKPSLEAILEFTSLA